MFPLKEVIKNNKLAVTISVFILIFTIIHVHKPSILYNNDGSFRIFGVGYRHKTVIPIWLISIVLAILCYIFISFYLANA